jgi:hypothetical protein
MFTVLVLVLMAGGGVAVVYVFRDACADIARNT